MTPRTIQKVMRGALPCRGNQFSHDCANSGGITMDTSALLKAFCSAVERRDGKAFGALFTPDGVYHDVFYGAFKGPDKIAEMVDDWFHRTARDFRWDMFRPVSDGKTLYAYYTFSYVSTLPEAQGRRVGFERV